MKWSQQKEYVLEQDMPLIWKIIDLYDPDRDKPTEEEQKEEAVRARNADLALQEEIRQLEQQAQQEES